MRIRVSRGKGREVVVVEADEYFNGISGGRNNNQLHSLLVSNGPLAVLKVEGGVNWSIRTIDRNLILLSLDRFVGCSSALSVILLLIYVRMILRFLLQVTFQGRNKSHHKAWDSYLSNVYKSAVDYGERERDKSLHMNWVGGYNNDNNYNNQALKECYTNIHLKVSTLMNHKSFLK